MSQNAGSQTTGFGLMGIGAAFAGFLLVFLQLQVPGLILGLVAIVLGAAGFQQAVKYQFTDRNQSLFSILLGVAAAVLAAVVLIF